MMHSARVVWQEGMHLSQHHFQAQSRHFENEIHFALSQMLAEPYGLAGIELDAEALLNGTIRLSHARGVMPDGLAFDMPESDPAPPPRDIRERFSPARGSHLVMLVLPSYRPGGANAGLSATDDRPGRPATTAAGAQPRFLPHAAQLPDELTGTDRKAVSVARKNFRLVLDEELAEGEVALAVARVRRDGAGHFVYDPDFIPPVLQIGASEHLMEMLRRLVEMLDARAESLRAAGDAEVAGRWLLHAVASSAAPLRHYLQVKRARPDQLFVEMSKLAGALCTFALDAHPRELPSYDHARLDECFAELDRHIRAHLGRVTQSVVIDVPLRSADGSLHVGVLSDARSLGPSRWILGLRATRSAVMGLNLIAKSPGLVKVCSAKFVLEIVRRGYPGLVLEHIPMPPATIGPRADFYYFSLAQQGPCWDTIVSTGEVGVYLPEVLREAEVELKVVLDS